MDWITPKDAMEVLGVGEAKLYALIREKKLPAYRTGDGPRARYRLKRGEVDSFLEQRRTMPRPAVAPVLPKPAKRATYTPRFDHGF